MMTEIVGIDPGKSGALVAIGGNIEGLKMPLSATNDIDCRTVRDFLIIHNPALVVIEKVGAMPGQGVKSMFSFGEAYGAVRAIVDAMEIPYMLVTPQAWKKKVLAGTKKEKADAIDYCRRRFPSLDLIPGKCRTPQDGLADAACIAEYGRLIIATPKEK